MTAPDLTPSRDSRTYSQRALLGRLGRACYRRSNLVLAIWGILLALCAWAMTHLAVDPDVAGLLPSHYESVQDVERVRERVGGVGFVVVLLEGGSREARRALAAAAQRELEQLESVSYVESRRPEAFVREKALWLMDLDDLGQLKSRVQDRYAHAVNRYFLDLDDKPPPEVRTDDLFERFRNRYGIRDGSEAASESAQTDFYEKGEKQALFVRPARLATDLEFSKRVVNDVSQVMNRVKKEEGAEGIQIELAGRYKKRVDLQEVLSRDLRMATGLALLLVVSYVWLHFRSWTAIVLLLSPLVSGLMLSYALAAITFGVLNILTAFLGAILVGLGVDTGIHLLGRIQEESSRGRDLEDSVETTLHSVGRVLVGASLTTAVAFGCLALTEFKAFREFGLLTSVGIVFVLLAYLTLIPAALRVAARFSVSRPSKRSATLPGIAWLLRHRTLALLLLGSPLIWLASRAPLAKFDSDLSRMDQADLPSFHLDSEINALLGRSQTPLVAFATDEEEARDIASTVRAQMKEFGDQATVGRVTTLAEFVPNNVEERAPLIESLRRMISRLPKGDGWLSQTDQTSIDIDTVVHSGPPMIDDLPPSIRAVVAPESNHGHGPLVLLYPTVSLGDAVAMERLSDQVRHIELQSGRTVRTAGEPMIVVDILNLLRRDGPLILLTSLILVVAVLAFTLGSVRLAIFSLLPAILILFVTAGSLAALGMKFTVLSVIILPVLLGIGVDDGAHLLSRLTDGGSVRTVWTHTGAAVSAALLTDTFGFGVLALASHPGLRGLGTAALIGLGANFVVCVLLLPLLVSLRPRLFSGSGNGHAPSFSQPLS